MKTPATANRSTPSTSSIPKRLPATIILSIALSVGSIGVADAEMCANDVVPGASLLVPYFEVDLNSPNGSTTLVSINNAAADPALAHITLWTDWSQPSIDFDVFLTGYDVVTMNLRDVFNGNIPITADDQSDPMDAISPHGNNPQWDGDFTDCQNFFPFFHNPVITGDNLTRLVNGHTGQDVLGQGCMGSTIGDNIARGFITIDSARRCSIEFPSDNQYFTGLDQVADNRNLLWGDFFLINPADNFALGSRLVHVEADESFDIGSTPSGYTFYGRYTQDTNGSDHREPLGSVWGFGYSDSQELGAATELLVWRDVSSRDVGTFYTCGVGPSWAGLRTDPIFCFDDEENPAEICRTGDCLPLATQRVAFGEGSLISPFDAGWCWIDMTVRDTDGGFDVDYPVGDPDGELGQGWVGALYTLQGLYSGGLTGVQLRSACDADFGIGLLGFFRDGFESGDFAAWSSASP